MSGSGLTIPFTGTSDPGDSVDVWARIAADPGESQEKCGETADLYDIAQMIGLARSGLSARAYLSGTCDSVIVKDNGDIDVTLKFYVFCCPYGLSYSLEADHGTISDAEKIRVPKDMLIKATMDRVIRLDWVFDGKIKKLTDCYDRFGNLLHMLPDAGGNLHIVKATLEGDNARILLTDEFFAVYRLTGDALGYEHEITMTVRKQDGYKVDALNNAITLRYEDLAGNIHTQRLVIGVASGSAETMDVPECVKSSLDTCDDGGLISSKIWPPIAPGGKEPTTVYYNGCTGAIL